TDHQLRPALDDRRVVGKDAPLRQWLGGQLGKDVVATGDPYQLGDPLDAGDPRLVPFFEVHPWTDAASGSALRTGIEIATPGIDQLLRGIAPAHQTAQPQHVVEDALDAAMV